jgi:hypothetical protein
MHGDPGDLVGAEVRPRATPPLVHLGGRHAQLPGGRLLEPRPQTEPPPQLRQILQVKGTIRTELVTHHKSR